ncbi:hypothetical protein LLE87_27195, partial [Paenibacillus polymyxa]|nr:hypothetical protein [Paenibacillus polymyxa]
MKPFARVLSGLALVCMTSLSAAQDYPNKPIRLIVPFPPGGGTDTLTRMIGSAISQDAGWNIVVENKPGANATIAANYVARAKPDGYTLVMSQTSVMAVNPRLYKNVGFDPLKDFVPISQITSAPLVLVSR